VNTAQGAALQHFFFSVTYIWIQWARQGLQGLTLTFNLPICKLRRKWSVGNMAPEHYALKHTNYEAYDQPPILIINVNTKPILQNIIGVNLLDCFIMYLLSPGVLKIHKRISKRTPNLSIWLSQESFVALKTDSLLSKTSYIWSKQHESDNKHHKYICTLLFSKLAYSYLH